MESSTEVIDADPLTEFFDAIKNPLTKASYTKRLALFFNFLKLEGTLKEQAGEFAKRARSDSKWATFQINEYMRMQKLRAEKKEISESTLPNFYKPIHLFCTMNDIVLNWEKISRRIPKGRQWADDRIPTVEEVKRLLEYPDTRVRIAVLVMLSSGCRVGAFDTMNWGHIEKIEKNGELIAAKVTVYPGTKYQYFTFITPEAYRMINGYIEFRKLSGEKIEKSSPLLRDLFPPEKGAKGEPHIAKRVRYDPLRNLIYKALVHTGLRKHLPEGKKRHEFSGDHAFRKFFTTVCNRHTSSLNVQSLRGDDLGLMESYNRPTEQYLLGEYLKAVPDLTILEPHVETVNSEDIESLKQRVALLEEANKKLLDDQKEYNEVLEDPRLQKLLLNMVREAIGSFGTAGSKKQERKPTH